MTATHLMSTYQPLALSFTRGLGTRLWDQAGREYLDAVAGVAVTNVGHSHPRVVSAITERCTEVDSGARNVDFILTQSVLPELSSLVLERLVLDKPFATIHMGLDAQGQFTYRFGTEVRGLVA